MMRTASMGIMQGRLLPQMGPHVQAFPGVRWDEEFRAAREIGFDAIELIYDDVRLEANPLRSDVSTPDLIARMRDTGVTVVSICAHYFTKHALSGDASRECQRNRDVLCDVTRRAVMIGAQVVVLPLMEACAVTTADALADMLKVLDDVSVKTRNFPIPFAVELALPAAVIVPVLRKRPPSRIRLAYDMGNATYFGHDYRTDVPQLAPYIALVHIKDRMKSGESVPLGRGDTDIAGVLQLLSRGKYRGPFTLETPRGTNPVRMAQENRAYVAPLVQHYFPE